MDKHHGYSGASRSHGHAPCLCCAFCVCIPQLLLWLYVGGIKCTSWSLLQNPCAPRVSTWGALAWQRLLSEGRFPPHHLLLLCAVHCSTRSFSLWVLSVAGDPLTLECSFIHFAHYWNWKEGKSCYLDTETVIVSCSYQMFPVQQYFLMSNFFHIGTFWWQCIWIASAPLYFFMYLLGCLLFSSSYLLQPQQRG